jgi:hypothetical protein
MSSLIGGSMKRIHLLVLLSLLALPLAAAPASGSGAGSIVVGELYASGGNSGAAYANDYVELFNRGTGTVAIDGWTLQYASAAGTTWQQTALTGSIPAGGSYLVQLASGGVTGAALPAADATGTSNLAATGGKVAIVDDATALSCGDAAGSCAGSASIEDLVGYGAAADYEGPVPRRRRARRSRSPAPGAGARIPTTARRTSPLRRRIRSTPRQRRPLARAPVAGAAAPGMRMSVSTSSPSSRLLSTTRR